MSAKAGTIPARRPERWGARIRIDRDRRTVIDGPFTESKELIARCWIIDVRSKEEAIAWMMRVPSPHNDGGELEIPEMFEPEDFGESPAIDLHRRLEAEMAKRR